jgi:diguanylate cyclase (GGDEF)-like protein/PAS domain S-box-containing protein
LTANSLNSGVYSRFGIFFIFFPFKSNVNITPLLEDYFSGEGHTVSYLGMPDFISPNSPNKQLDFWLSARFLASGALLIVSIRAWNQLISNGIRFLIFGALFALMLLIGWVVIYRQAWLPDVFVVGPGLTQLKKNIEYMIMAIDIATAVILLTKMRKRQQFNVVLIFGAVVTLTMSEFFFTLYTNLIGSYNVLGHIYKAIGYLLIYRAIVVEVIEEPYKLLEQAQQKLSRSIKASSTGLWDWELKTNSVYFSDEWKAQLGYAPDELPNQAATWESLIHPEDREAVKRTLRDFLASSNKLYKNEYRMRHRDGSYRWIISRGEKQQDENGNAIHLAGSHIDITERKNIEAALELNQFSLDHAQDAIFRLDKDAQIRYVNDAACKHLGYTKEELLSFKLYQIDPAFSMERWKDYWRSMFEGSVNRFETSHTRKDGSIVPVEIAANFMEFEGEFFSFASARDISERKADEERIRLLAFHDSLTLLPNRQLLLDRLRQALTSSARNGWNGALLFIDLDDFKTLNDTLGHQTGDLLLQNVALRLTDCVRGGDTVARLGGDEFVVILEELSDQANEAGAQVEFVGEKILASLREPYQLGTRVYRSTSSIGATLFNKNHQEVGDLLKQADIAMYQAKKAGRNTMRFFDPEMQKTINERVALEAELLRAIEFHQLHLYYQIQMDHSRRPLGAEALIRWIHPEYGIVSPAKFIPLAEETGLILPIGNWVLKTACAQIKSWERDEETRNLALAINVSASQFHQADFVEQVQAVVKNYSINPYLLKLELTESMLLGDIDNTVTTMNRLSMIGVQLSLDDFGTGYSSLQYLKKLPLNQIKIDQSFVRDITTDPNDIAIVKTIIAMAESLGLEVIAEGVETEQQQLLLLGNGCNHYQGYLFGRPMPAKEFDAALKKLPA